MKKLKGSLFLVAVLVSAMSAPVLAWGPVSHGDIASRILEDPDIAWCVSYYGLNTTTVIAQAAAGDLNEPAAWHQTKWGDIRSLAEMNASWMTSSRPVNNDNLGFLLHNIADAAVPVDHCPACDVYSGASWAENMFEYQGNAYGTPAWPSPPYYTSDWTNYDGYVAYHVTNMHNLATTFKNHNESYWPCKYLHACMTDWIDPDCRRAAFKLGWETAYWYMGMR
jgi:hypothetical protein